MSDADSNEAGRTKGSLLSLGGARPAGEESRPALARSLLSVVGADDEPARERHRRARQEHAAAVAAAAPAAKTAPSAAPPDIPADPIVAPGLAERLKARVAALRERRPTVAEERPSPPPAPLQSDREPSRPEAPETPAIAPPARVRRATDDPGNPYWRPLIDPVKVISGVIEARRIILATTILGGMLGVAVALSTPKQYESTTELLVDPRNLNIVDREITQEGLPSDATLAIVENQARVMTSGTVIDKVVDKLNLSADPEFNGEAGGGLSIRGVISELRALLSGDDGGEAVDVRQAIAVGNLYDALTVERGSKTFVISVSARTREPEKSALIANTLTDVFLETYGELQSGTAGRATDELTARLDQLRVSVEAAERKVEAFKAQNEIIDPQGRLITDDEIVKLNDQLSVARARTIELNARAQSARSVDVDQVLDGTLPEQAASGLMTELRSQYATLKQEADRLAVRLGPRHPERIAVEAQLAGAREQIQNELRRLNTGIQVDLKRAVQLEQDLASRLARLKVQKGDLSNELVTLRELERDATSKRAVYEAYLLRARETGEQQSLNTANVSVISKAHPALLPIGPSRALISIAGAMLGFAAGAGMGAARGACRSFRDNSTGEPAPAATAAVEDSAYRDRTPEPPEPALAEDGGATRSDESEKDMMQLVYSDDRERRLAAAHGFHPPHPQPAYPGQAAAYPPYPQPAPPQPYAGMPPQGWPQQAYTAPPPQPPIHQQAHPQAVYPHPQAPQGWQPQGYPAYPYAPVPAYADPYGYAMQPPQQAGYPQQPAPHLSVVEPAQPTAEERTRTAIDEIRDSLREFREAIRELTESRKTRRYF